MKFRQSVFRDEVKTGHKLHSQPSASQRERKPLADGVLQFPHAFSRENGAASHRYRRHRHGKNSALPTLRRRHNRGSTQAKSEPPLRACELPRVQGQTFADNSACSQRVAPEFSETRLLTRRNTPNSAAESGRRRRVYDSQLWTSLTASSKPKAQTPFTASRGYRK